MAEESSSTKKVFLKKDQREACWKARDTFWKCMNTNEQDGYSISILVYRRKKIDVENNHVCLQFQGKVYGGTKTI